jgi:hypothetical protein
MSESAKTEHIPRYHLGIGSRTHPVVQRKDCVVALEALAEDTRVSIVSC